MHKSTKELHIDIAKNKLKLLKRSLEKDMKSKLWSDVLFVSAISRHVLATIERFVNQNRVIAWNRASSDYIMTLTVTFYSTYDAPVEMDDYCESILNTLDIYSNIVIHLLMDSRSVFSLTTEEIQMIMDTTKYDEREISDGKK